MKIEATSIQELIEKSADHKEKMIELDKFITDTLPELDRRIYITNSMSMIGWGEMPYKGGTWPLIALAPQKHTVNIYISAIKDGTYMLDVYGSALGKISCGKSCARIKKIEDMNKDEWVKMLRESYDYFEETVKCVNK